LEFYLAAVLINFNTWCNFNCRIFVPQSAIFRASEEEEEEEEKLFSFARSPRRRSLPTNRPRNKCLEKDPTR
jgi:hypothetical protein